MALIDVGYLEAVQPLQRASGTRQTQIATITKGGGYEAFPRRGDFQKLTVRFCPFREQTPSRLQNLKHDSCFLIDHCGFCHRGSLHSYKRRKGLLVASEV